VLGTKLTQLTKTRIEKTNKLYRAESFLRSQRFFC